MMRWLIDLDGVVWRATTLVEGTDLALAQLRARGDSVRFVTNNSTLSAQDYVAKLASFGIEASVEEVLTSAMAARLALGASQRVFAIGEEGLRSEVAKGNELVTPNELEDAEGLDAVVMGWHRGLTWDLLARACVAIRSGARFFATNRDATYPLERLIVPGTGALVASLVAATAVEPTYCGKPDWPMVELASSHVLPGDTLMVGDRLSTDGAFAAALGVPFALVRSGVAEPAQAGIDVAIEAPTLRHLVANVIEREPKLS